MNLDRYIKIQLLMLSDRYEITIIEFTKVEDNKIKKSYNVNLKSKFDNYTDKKWFSNKQKLVSWLVCLN